MCRRTPPPPEVLLLCIAQWEEIKRWPDLHTNAASAPPWFTTHHKADKLSSFWSPPSPTLNFNYFRVGKKFILFLRDISYFVGITRPQPSQYKWCIHSIMIMTFQLFFDDTNFIGNHWHDWDSITHKIVTNYTAQRNNMLTAAILVMEVYNNFIELCNGLANKSCVSVAWGDNVRTEPRTSFHDGKWYWLNNLDSKWTGHFVI